MITINLTRVECEELLKLVLPLDNIELDLVDFKLQQGLRELSESLSPIGYSRLRFNGLSKNLIKESYGMNDFDLEVLELCHDEYMDKYKKGE